MAGDHGTSSIFLGGIGSKDVQSSEVVPLAFAVRALRKRELSWPV